MKKLILNIALAAAMLATATLTACSDDVPAGADVTGIANQSPQLQGIEAVDSGFVSLHDHYAAIIAQASQADDPESQAMVEYATKQLAEVDAYDADHNQQAAQSGAPRRATGVDGKEGQNPAVGYKYVNLRYESVDKDGKPITLSEMIFFPYLLIGSNPKPDNVVIGCHVTIASNKERPTNYESFTSDIGMFACHASAIMQSDVRGNLVIVPDYQGYGATSTDAHPYLYQELTAHQVVDGVLAGIEWFTANQKAMNDGWRSISIGYSQGGSVAMAVQKYVTQHGLRSRLNFAGSVCGDGPYDPVATLQEYIKTGRIYMPVAVGMIIKGMCDANPYIVGKYKPEDYFTDRFLKSGILDWIKSKEFTTGEIQQKLLDYSKSNSNGFVMMGKTKSDGYKPYTAANASLKWDDLTGAFGSYCSVEETMRPEVIEYFKKCTNGRKAAGQPKLVALYDALDMNNLTKGWTAVEPVFMFHSTRDEVVPFVNYQSAIDQFGNYGKGIKYRNSSTYAHTSTGTKFFVTYEPKYVKEVLGDKWSTRAHESVQD